MKELLVIFASVLLLHTAAAQKETFDIITCTTDFLKTTHALVKK